jgi:hypothetical protein
VSKESGIGDALYVGEYDLSGDIGAVNTIETTRGVLGVTAINASAEERIVGLKDGSLAFSSYWNAVAGQAHPVLSALPRTDRIVSYFHGATVGNAAASMVGKQLGYAPTRGQDGSLVADTQAAANGYGLEWSGGGTGDGMLTTGKQSFATGTVNGTSINLGSTSTLFGAAAYLHVFSIASGTATFTVQDSDDNSTFLPITGMGFTAVTAATSERVQGAVNATVRQYVRIQCTGTHGACVVAINFIRYLTDPGL